MPVLVWVPVPCGCLSQLACCCRTAAHGHLQTLWPSQEAAPLPAPGAPGTAPAFTLCCPASWPDWLRAHYLATLCGLNARSPACPFRLESATCAHLFNACLYRRQLRSQTHSLHCSSLWFGSKDVQEAQPHAPVDRKKGALDDCRWLPGALSQVSIIAHCVLRSSLSLL